MIETHYLIGLVLALAIIVGLVWLAMEWEYQIKAMPARRVSRMIRRGERRKWNG